MKGRRSARLGQRESKLLDGLALTLSLSSVRNRNEEGATTRMLAITERSDQKRQ